MAIKPERFAEIFATGDKSRKMMSSEEQVEILHVWDKCPGDTSWAFAFHKRWREVDPVGHLARFRGTFYETEQSMLADDDDELEGKK